MACHRGSRGFADMQNVPMLTYFVIALNWVYGVRRLLPYLCASIGVSGCNEFQALSEASPCPLEDHSQRNDKFVLEIGRAHV